MHSEKICADDCGKQGSLEEVERASFTLASPSSGLREVEEREMVKNRRC